MLLSALFFVVVNAGPVPLVAGAPAVAAPLEVAAPIETVHRRRDPVPLPPRFRSPISLGISWIGRTIAAVGAVLMAFSFIAGFLALVGAIVVLATQSLGPMSIPVAILLLG